MSLLHGRPKGDALRLDAEHAGRLLELGENAPVKRLESSSLGGAEVLGQRERREALERPADLLEPYLERERSRREWRGVLVIVTDKGERLAQESSSLRLVGRPVGAHEADRLARLEVVALDRGDEGFLLSRRDRAERVGERGTDRAVRDTALDPGREPRPERHTAFDPHELPSEQTCHGKQRQAVVRDERADDARLVDRGQGPRRRVRVEEEPLVLGRSPGALDEHGDERDALGAPALEPLEAVDNLVDPVLRLDDPEREVGRSRSARPARARTERGVARADALERKEVDGRRGSLRRRHGSERRRARDRSRHCRCSERDGARPVTRDAKAALALPLVVLDSHFELRSEEVGRFDLDALPRLDAAGPIELDESPP
jgi:hypothetical protein